MMGLRVSYYEDILEKSSPPPHPPPPTLSKILKLKLGLFYSFFPPTLPHPFGNYPKNFPVLYLILIYFFGKNKLILRQNPVFFFLVEIVLSSLTLSLVDFLFFVCFFSTLPLLTFQSLELLCHVSVVSSPVIPLLLSRETRQITGIRVLLLGKHFLTNMRFFHKVKGEGLWLFFF